MSDSELDARVAWQHHLGAGRVADRWRDSVLDRYREPQRHYHDVRHVRWVVHHVRALAERHVLVDLDAVVAAAFFHDVVYDPRAVDNEAASARLAVVALTELDWSAPRIESVTALIDGTIGHGWSGAPVDHAVLFAADLAVLAAEPAGYSDYVRAVRREYHHVDDLAWVNGRGAVLQRFLDRSAIYAPSLGLDNWERRARANITAEHTMLGG